MIRNRQFIVLLVILISVFCLGLFSCRQNSRFEDLIEMDGSPSDTGFVSSVQDEIYISRSNAITRAVHDVSPAVVGIDVKQIRQVRRRSYYTDPLWELFYPRQRYTEVPSLGSGFIISSDGYILTNQHVVEEATEITVTTTDGSRYSAEIIGQDSKYDVALLKIDIEDSPYIPLGDSDDIIIAEWVIALGNPFGLFDVNAKPTVTVGVVSATDMDFSSELFEGKSYVSMIQTDASINGGNSGGPLVNSNGQCIGINTFIFSSGNNGKGSIGLGFAIPINRVKEILPILKNVGFIDRSFSTGLRVENIPYYTARSLNIYSNDGVIVQAVEPGSAAAEAGIKKGDIIIGMDGKRVRSTVDARRYIDQFDVREQNILNVQVFRDNKISNFELNVK